MKTIAGTGASTKKNLTFRLAHLQGRAPVSELAFCLALAASTCPVRGAGTAANEAVSPAANAAPAAEATPAPRATEAMASWPEDTRVSLELQRAPLSQVLGVLGRQSGLRFRYAALPDVQVSVSLQNAPLRAAVLNILQANGFDLRVGPGAFWLVAAPTPAAAPTVAPRGPARSGQGRVAKGRPPAPSEDSEHARKTGESWQWWTYAEAPPARWAAVGADSRLAFESAPSDTGVPGLAPLGVSVRVRAAAPPLSRWRTGSLAFGASQPGAQPILGPAANLNPTPDSSPGGETKWRARWPMVLRKPPARCVLVIETDRPAHLFVNGARLLHGWTGRRTLDLSAALAAGPNLLAIEWPPTVDSTVDSNAPTSDPSTSPPRVSFEWLVAR